MEEYKFVVTETVRKTVTVVASDYRNAHDQIETMLTNGDIDMEKDIDNSNMRFCLASVYPDS